MKKTVWFLLCFMLVANVLQVSAQEKKPSPPKKAIYFSIAEPFTINFFNQSKQEVRYLQIKVTLMSRNKSVIENAELNLPMLQDALRILFAEQSYDAINTVAGRKALQSESLKRLKAILKEETGEDGLNAVYFTSFVLQ